MNSYHCLSFVDLKIDLQEKEHALARQGDPGSDGKKPESRPEFYNFLNTSDSEIDEMPVCEEKREEDSAAHTEPVHEGTIEGPAADVVMDCLSPVVRKRDPDGVQL